MQTLKHESKITSEEDIFILWKKEKKTVRPERPENPELIPETESLHWYDYEYAGEWAEKLPMPISLGNGPSGKRIIAILPGEHPYHVDFSSSMQKVAEDAGMFLKILIGDHTSDGQYVLIKEAIQASPDMIILNPVSMGKSTEWFHEIYEKGIPAIGCNMIPANDAFKYILAWTGPDAWGEFRMLARKFALLMDAKGGYAIIRHIPESSTFISRTWSVITELKQIAPSMRCLDMDTSYLEIDKTEELVTSWIEKYGKDLKGIVSCDDCTVQIGINNALDKANRSDIIVVANGSTKVGMDFIRKGKLDAICLKSPIVDGATPIKVAIDWFNGLAIDPITYLPKHIITPDDVDDMFLYNYELKHIGLFSMIQAINENNVDKLKRVFQDFYGKFSESKIVSLEYFRGFSIELISKYYQLISEYNFDSEEVLGSYESIFKNLFRQKTLENTLSWLFSIAEKLMYLINETDTSMTLIERVVYFTDRNYHKPISLKSIASEFNITPKYLGQEFRLHIGTSFTAYITQKRMDRAGLLLENTSNQVVEIAKGLGFLNTNYFFTTFKKFYGCTPTEYRERETR